MWSQSKNKKVTKRNVKSRTSGKQPRNRTEINRTKGIHNTNVSLWCPWLSVVFVSFDASALIFFQLLLLLLIFLWCLCVRVCFAFFQFLDLFCFYFTVAVTTAAPLFSFCLLATPNCTPSNVGRLHDDTLREALTKA